MAGRLVRRKPGGEFDTALHHSHAALALYHRLQDPRGEADVADTLGLVAHRTGDHLQAIGHYHHAIALRRAQTNTYETAHTLDRMGHPHAALGRQEEARMFWREALALYREQSRDTDAIRIQQQLDDLDTHHDAAQPPRDAESAK